MKNSERDGSRPLDPATEATAKRLAEAIDARLDARTPGRGRDRADDQPAPDPALAHELRVTDELDRERARREARRRLDAEERGRLAVPDFVTLRDRLIRPQSATTWRIENWQPADSRVILAAQFKAGKSTLVENVIRALIDGDPFLGRDPVTPITGTLALLDFEMSARQLDAWLRDQRIAGDDRVLVVSLRGAAAAFDILDERVRAEWAARFIAAGVAYLTVDCMRPIFDALGLDEHRDGGRFLVALDALLAEAGIREALVVHHMGHQGERSRGDSRFRDWPDAEWRLVRQDDDPAAARFLTAYGRDVDVPEQRISFDPISRRVTLAGGSRREAAAEGALEAVLDVLGTAEPLSVRGIQTALADSEHARDTIRAAIRLGVRTGQIATEPGSRGAILHRRVCERAGVCGECAAHGASECAAPYIEPHARTLLDVDQNTETVRTLKPAFVFDPTTAFADPAGVKR